MHLIYLFCAFLFVGMGISQVFDLAPYRHSLTLIADGCLAYIMLEVGLEFVMDKTKWRRYVKDYFVAMLAAALPWIFCFLYFLYFIRSNRWEELLLIARFAAPTSSGLLFSMLGAAGLAATWLFRKVEVLAILDDVDTILLLIPLQFLLGANNYGQIFVIVLVVVLIYLAWKYLHALRLPVKRGWLLFYAFLMTCIVAITNHSFSVDIEILLPAFVFGCILHNPHDPRRKKLHRHEHAYIEAEGRGERILDRSVKVFFMLLLGLLLPQIAFDSFNLWWLASHVLIITLLANLGKCAPIFFYKKEATLKERTAVAVGMFPRGEVGAGILVLALEHGAQGYATTVAGLSLALNLLLTGFFIWIVVRLVGKGEVA